MMEYFSCRCAKVVILIMNCICHSISGIKLLKEAKLHEDMFRNYNPKVRPVTDPKSVLEVVVQMYFLRISDLSEKNQVLTSSIWMDIRWRDQLLFWNESEHGGVEYILAVKEKIWTPDLLIQNEIGNKREIGETTLNDPIVLSTGEVTWWPGKEIKTTCKVDSTKYPFDAQYCEIEISKWYSNDNTLNVTFMTKKIDLAHYEQNEEWEVLGTDVKKVVHFEASQNFSRIKYGLMLRRRPLFYVLNVMVPLVILSALNQICFLLPIESGEKIGMCMSIFLTFVVFLTLISDTLPQSSIHIPLFGGYLVFQLIISGLIIGLEVFVLHVYHEQGKKRLRCIPCTKRGISDEQLLVKSIERKKEQTRHLNNDILRISTELENHVYCNDRAHAQEEDVDIGVTQAAKLDKIFGFSVLAVNTLALLTLFILLNL